MSKISFDGRMKRQALQRTLLHEAGGKSMRQVAVEKCVVAMKARLGKLPMQRNLKSINFQC